MGITEWRLLQRQKDESGFVSLRDIERTLKVFQWFREHDQLFFEDPEPNLSRALVLALAICYRASLQVPPFLHFST